MADLMNWLISPVYDPATFGFQTASSNDLSKQSYATGLENWFTGNLDFQRELDLQNRTMKFNAEEAQKQRDYEERLANTAYSRAVKDMSNAGLNPYLAYSSGGAFTPSGSSASVPSSHATPSGKGFNDLFGLVSSLIRGNYMLLSQANRKPNVKNITYNKYEVPLKL